MKYSQNLFYLSIILLFTLITACGTESANDGDSTRYYRFTHQSDDIDYTFVAKTSNAEVIAKLEEELQKSFDERNMHINGPIERGEEEYNSKWSWHFIENRWDIVEVSTEVCDGRPSFVEEETDYWVDQVGRFCPWSSVVEAEVNPS